jgi:hypothetical protein
MVDGLWSMVDQVEKPEPEARLFNLKGFTSSFSNLASTIDHRTSNIESKRRD